MDGDFRADRWRGPRALLNQRVCKLTVSNDSLYSESFLRWVLPGYLDAIHRETSSVTVKHLSSETIKELPIPLPPRMEQDQIVAAIEEQFSRLEAGVAALERARQNLKRMRAAILQYAATGTLLRDGVSNTPQEPVHSPSSWRWVSWGDVLAEGRESFRRGPFGSTITKAMFVPSGYKVYEQYCAINDDCSFGRYYITADKYSELQRFAVQAGDFLISCSGVTLGRITRVPNDFEEGIINQALLRVRINEDLLDPEYFVTVFRSPFFQRHIFANSTGSAIPNVKGVKDLKAIPFPMPPVAEQRRIVEVVKNLQVGVGIGEHEVQRASKRAEHLRSAILTSAFLGDLAPQHPDDQPATALLGRIASERGSSTGQGSTRLGAPGAIQQKVTA